MLVKFKSRLARFVIVIIEIPVTGTVKSLCHRSDKRTDRHAFRLLQSDRIIDKLYSLVVDFLVHNNSSLPESPKVNLLFNSENFV